MKSILLLPAEIKNDQTVDLIIFVIVDPSGFEPLAS